MAYQQGIKGFAARKEDPGAVAQYPFAVASADTSKFYDGTPCILASGNVVTRAAVDGAGLITSTKLHGFSNVGHDVDAAYNTANFVQFPYLYEPGTGRRELGLYVATGRTLFTGQLASGIVLTPAQVNITCNLREQPVGSGQFVVDTSSTANGLVTTVAMHPSDVNKLGGRVDFIVASGKSSYLAP